MAKSINYGQLTQKAFRQVMADVLTIVAREGLPGKHHLFITFDTTHPGVDMADSLMARYPEEMTIVLQEWFADLAVMKDRFSVTLSFGNVPEPIVVPFESIKTFVDPSVEFGLRFNAQEVSEAYPGAEGDDDDESDDAAPTESVTMKHGEGEVVSLDKFRKH